jgi:serine/threonine-protein kinase
VAARLSASVEGAVARPPSPASLGFGHGAAGILHAILAWTERSDEPAPATVVRALEALGEAEDAGAFGPVAGQPRWLPSSFCAGSPGLVLLWVKAYEVTGRRCFLDRAEKHGLGILAAPAHANANLCCGAAGRAYALLALDRVQPDRGWEDRAAVFAVYAVRVFLARPGQWSHGLFKGAPGIACLAQDLSLERGTRGGFPLVES